MATAELQLPAQASECASTSREVWLTRARLGARILFWSWAAYWGLEILDPLWILGLISGSSFYLSHVWPIHELQAMQTWLLAPVLVGAFLMARPAPGGGRELTGLSARLVMGVAAACATIELALAIDGIVSHTHTIETALTWGRLSAKYLSVVVILFYMGYLALRFDRRGLARLAAVMACGHFVLGAVCFVMHMLESGSIWSVRSSVGASYRAHFEMYCLIRMAVQLAVWTPTLVVTWKFGSMLRNAAAGKCLCCGYPVRDLLSGRCPECGAKSA
jgi:hypothetical protein